MQDAGTGDAAATRSGRQPAISSVSSPSSVSGARRPPARALRMGFVLDVAGYGARSVPQRNDVQKRLRKLVESTLAECGLKLGERDLDHQWTGDGINAVLPTDIDPTVVLTMLIRSLSASLSSDNAGQADRVRLRMAVGFGLIERSEAGFGGPVIVDINRLVDSAPLRSALADEPAADLAVAIADQVHALIVQPGYPGIPEAQFSRVTVAVKEFSGPAWIWVSSRQWSETMFAPLGGSDPREVGRYRIAARLGGPGSGGLGSGNPGSGNPGSGNSVYLASGDGGSGGSGAGEPGWVALKVFDRRLAEDPDVRRRLAVGALAARVVSDPHVASVIDGETGEDQGQPWVASALVRGPSLAAAVTETGPLPSAAGWIALGLAGALATLHDAGFSHHAVTPGNTLLGLAGPVLTDFGVSRTALVAGPGTPADDVRTLGATAFFAATGRSPDDQPANHRDLTGCPPRLAPIVLACLAPDPAARPGAAYLHAWLADEVGPRPRSWLPEPVAARVLEYQALRPARGRFRWPRGRD
jgi:hypothetical protein